MEAIRTKDKLFLAIVVPVAVVAAYVYLWRNAATRRTDALEGEKAALVSVEDFPFERDRARRRLKAANEELAAERKIPVPVAKVKANPAESVAARELAVLEIFRESRLSVITVASSREEDLHASRAADILRATGSLPNPVRRTYDVIGTYPAVLSALRTFHTREMAVIPERVTMSKACRWSIIVCL